MEAELAKELKKQFQTEAISAVFECLNLDVGVTEIEERGLLRPRINGWEVFYFDEIELLMIGPVEMKFSSSNGRHSVTATREFKKTYQLKAAVI